MYFGALADPEVHIFWFIIVQGGNRRVTGMYRGRFCPEFALRRPALAMERSLYGPFSR